MKFARTNFSRAFFATIALSCILTSRAAPVNVAQVEADADSNTDGPQYAPVNFAGSTTKTSGGVTYHALSDPGSDTTSTYSGHAATVRNRLLAADGANDPIEDIYCLYAGDFLGTYLYTPSSTSQNATRPETIGNGIKVMNHSYIQGFNTTDENKDAIRKLDYMTRREDLVNVTGAMSPNPQNNSHETPLLWANRNGLAVRGTQTFNPTHADGIGKTHADLWGPKNGSGNDEASSYETPGVAGYAAGLIDLADQNGWDNGTNGLRHEVVKSILMTGTDKTDFSSNGFTSWTNETANNLDNHNGAGRADYDTSQNVLIAGPQTVAEVSGSTIENPNLTSSLEGWWYEDAIPGADKQALILDLSEQSITELTATLAWDVTQEETTQGPFQILDTTDAGQIFANLDLELLPVIESNGTYTLGDSLGIAGLSSTATEDNLEHLYFTDASLDAGLYAFTISNNSDFSWNYGFSYSAIVIPEPTALLLLVSAGAICLFRRHT